MSGGIFAQARAQGAEDARAGRTLFECRFGMKALRAAWVEGWLAERVSMLTSVGNELAGLPVKHAERRYARWLPVEAVALEAAYAAAPKVSLKVLALLLGRSHDSLRIEACRRGLTRRRGHAAPGAKGEKRAA